MGQAAAHRLVRAAGVATPLVGVAKRGQGGLGRLVRGHTAARGRASRRILATSSGATTGSPAPSCPGSDSSTSCARPPPWFVTRNQTAARPDGAGSYLEVVVVVVVAGQVLDLTGSVALGNFIEHG